MRPIELDIECYRNYFLIKLRNHADGRVVEFSMYPGSEPIDTQRLIKILRTFTIYTFNGNNYDMPMIHLLVRLMVQGVEPGRACIELKQASDWIIQGQNRGWQFMQQFELVEITGIDHIDLIEVAFGQGSLKLYGGRLHSRKLQDLPIEPEAHISPADRVRLSDYCGNDLETTADLRVHLTPQIALRETMTATYGVDLRSKSDAQIAEAVIKSELQRLISVMVKKPNIPAGTRFHYQAPAFVQFLSPELQALKQEILFADFVIADTGQPIEPACLANRVITIGKSAYRMGIGGLHSSETTTAHFADDNTLLIDRDVASYYPAIILQCGLFPKHLTGAFLTVYRSIFDRRLAAKKSGDKTVADTLKIVLNGSFGKFGSMYSVLYSPDLMIQVTVTGQLCLLMLIEWIELRLGIPVVSANTDGIVIKCPADRKAELDAVVALWEKRTGFETEETRYRALLSRDVNNYLAIKDREYYRETLPPAEFAKMDKGGWIKGKGAFAPVTISKNPVNNICTEAASAFVEHGTPIAETIFRCRDIRKFVTVRTVRGGAIKVTKTHYDESLTLSKKRDLLLMLGWQITHGSKVADIHVTAPGTMDTMGEHGIPLEEAYRKYCGDDEFDYIGKVVRWYYAVGETGVLRYKNPNKQGTRNTVPNSEGAKPLMELPDEFPDDVDYDFYLAETNRILKDIGLWKGLSHG